LANLARLDQVIERVQRLLHRRQRVEGMDLVHVDGVRPEPPQAALARRDQVLTRRAHVVRPRPRPLAALGRQDHPLAPPLDRLAQDLLGQPIRVDVRRVEHFEPRLEAHVDQPRGPGHVARPPSLEELRPAAKRTRPQAKHRDLET